MPDRTMRSIVIDAPADAVMGVIADLEAYPAWVTGAKSVTVTEIDASGRARSAEFVLDAGPVKDNYELCYTWHPDGRGVSWTLVRGDIQTAQDGTYSLVELPGGGTEVTYELTVDLAIPMIGEFKRKAEKLVTDTALKELKKRVEG